MEQLIVHDDDPVQIYVSQVKSIAPLTLEEEAALWGRLRTPVEPGEAAFRRLMEANLSLVIAVAERFRTSGVHILDLIEAGNGGLLDAIQTFADGTVALSFPDYAKARIEEAILAAIGDARDHGRE